MCRKDAVEDGELDIPVRNLAQGCAPSEIEMGEFAGCFFAGFFAKRLERRFPRVARVVTNAEGHFRSGTIQTMTHF